MFILVSQMYSDEIHVLMAVVTYKTKMFKPRLGVCSTWLAGMSPGTIVPLWVKKGTIAFPTDPACPVVMVGPGMFVKTFNQELNILTFQCLVVKRDCDSIYGSNCIA